jgi:hypothetical protein
MIYLQRNATDDDGSPSIDIAVIEDRRSAERYESCGYIRCSIDAFRAAWRLRDERSLARLRAAAVVEDQLAVSQRGIYPALS